MSETISEVWASNDLLEQTRAGVEIWRPIVGSYGWYDVSNLGNVRSWKGSDGLRSEKPNQLKPSPQTDGYPCIGMRLNGRAVIATVHAAMAEAFIGPRPGPTAVWECGHDDDDRTNNRLDNLKWCTRKVNHADRKKNGRIPKKPAGPKCAASVVRGRMGVGRCSLTAANGDLCHRHAAIEDRGRTVHRTKA